jgi:hypothetical protein
MTKKNLPKRKAASGPYLATAVFCDNILHGEDKALSAIRIIDKVTVAVPADAPPDFPSETHRLPVVVWTLIMFKSVGAPGRHEVKLVINSPGGKSQEGMTRLLDFSEEPSGGANLKIHLGIGVKSGGLFTVDVLVDGKLMTRMPLFVTVAREQPPASATPALPAPSKNSSAKRTAKARAKKK